MQENEKGEWVPVQWSSKKFTPTEVRYGISEKEMYAVFFLGEGVKNFECELRGRRFKIETDHKPLAEIRNMADFNNARINRWIEEIQEFDFEVEYRTPEKMIVADTLSRLYMSEVDNGKKEMIDARKEKQVEGKRAKHSKVVNGEEMWKFDNCEEKEILKDNDRVPIIKQYHEILGHRGKTSVYY
ncbi:Retrovirus-related Pol polyprotein from transposon 17.6 [Nosema granulosis]|uniref:Retrovirus-related Pol polyprotein from transposon 17.6 n=1 Tax=Nosema granulosis TaxID=83296 RepID=A0A9P6GY36_9MICR|nr:Retrovirus-related Pol polyprotein from transposon 17.6 [Nosema granulosis]